MQRTNMWIQGGKGRVGEWEIGTDIYTVPCKK